MKKFIIIAATALTAMLACTKTELSMDTPRQRIAFQVANYSASTKAGDKDTVEYSRSIPFGTMAWFYTDRNAGTVSQPFMEHETVSFDSDSTIWKPSVTYYWPKTGSIDFLSYSPRTIGPTLVEGKFVGGYVTATEDTIAFGKDNVYTVGTDDVLFADKAIEQHLNTNPATYGKWSGVKEGVPTLFHHALANFNLSIKTKYDEKVASPGDTTKWKVDVVGIDLEKLFNQGSSTFIINDDGKTWKYPADSVWTNNGNTINPDFDPSDPTTVNSETATDFIKNYFVLPQDLEDQEITVTVDITTTLPNGKTIVEKGVELKVKLKIEDLIEAWKIGKKIDYSLLIVPVSEDKYGNPDAILFDPAVEDWSDTVSGSASL